MRLLWHPTWRDVRSIQMSITANVDTPNVEELANLLWPNEYSRGQFRRVNIYNSMKADSIKMAIELLKKVYNFALFIFSIFI